MCRRGVCLLARSAEEFTPDQVRMRHAIIELGFRRNSLNSLKVYIPLDILEKSRILVYITIQKQLCDRVCRTW
tara:strand:+ start:2917 stop:3135 length:219 start_codon:yes stop_codon:yes gene_type:complete